jgi:hypothetical protein
MTIIQPIEENKEIKLQVFKDLTVKGYVHPDIFNGFTKDELEAMIKYLQEVKSTNETKETEGVK